jgi:ADP-ribose pyrophosphatase YjhB (NUDIX family)/predicted transcriptional regulator
MHNIQMLILRELLFSPNSKFTQLNIQGLTSDHFSYHINTLIKDGYVKKTSLKYSLTPKGKEFANRMDTEEVSIEKQPKVAVMVVATKIENGKKYLLVQERTKEPYFGYSGFITGKIRFGERVIEAAKRELKEESGLSCENIHLKKLVRDYVVLNDTGELVEDKMFFVVHAVNPKGNLVNTKNGNNRWLTENEFKHLKKKYYNEDSIYEISQGRSSQTIIEGTYLVDDF